MIDSLLSNFESNINLSDILLTEDDAISIRVWWEIQTLVQKISSDQINQIIKEILDQNNIWLSSDQIHEIDVWYTHGSQWYRVNIFKKAGKKALAIRKLTNFDIDLKDIMIESLANTIQKKILEKRSGLFLVTGTAGSGKSTTMIWCLEYINKNYQKHIITLEDPTEYVFTPKKSIFSQREVWSDTISFETGLKSLLRQNPDVVMVWEIRDPISAEAVINIAETWHLVISTLHTKSAVNTISRLVSFFPPHYQDSIKDRLADVYLWSLAQALVKVPDDIKITPSNKNILSKWRGRIGEFELCLNNTAMANTIRKGDFKSIPNIIQTGISEGMISLEDYRKIIWLS